MTGAKEPELLTYADAGRLLGVPVGTLYVLVHLRRIPHLRLGERLIRFNARELQSWLACGAAPRSGKFSGTRAPGHGNAP